MHLKACTRRDQDSKIMQYEIKLRENVVTSKILVDVEDPWVCAIGGLLHAAHALICRVGGPVSPLPCIVVDAVLVHLIARLVVDVVVDGTLIHKCEPLEVGLHTRR